MHARLMNESGEEEPSLNSGQNPLLASLWDGDSKKSCHRNGIEWPDWIEAFEKAAKAARYLAEAKLVTAKEQALVRARQDAALRARSLINSDFKESLRERGQGRISQSLRVRA